MSELAIGLVLEGPEDRIRLVGVDAGGWIAECLDEFGPPRRIAPQELISVYGVSDPSVPSPAPVDQNAKLQAMAARYGQSFGEGIGTKAPPPPGSPEARFKEAE